MATRSLTTEPGYINNNRQKVLRRIEHMEAEQEGQYTYELECLLCKARYGSDGISNHQRKCPSCQGGVKGKPVPPPRPTLFG